MSRALAFLKNWRTLDSDKITIAVGIVALAFLYWLHWHGLI